MTKLFGVNIAAELNKAMGKGLLDVTLQKATPGTRTPGSLTGGTNPTTATYTGKGFKDSVNSLKPDTRVDGAEDVFLVLGDSLPVTPKAGDYIKLTSESDYRTILKVDTDPADATHLCQTD